MKLPKTTVFLIAFFTICAVGVNCDQRNAGKKLSDIWKFDSAGLGVDASVWPEEAKAKVVNAALVASAAVFLGFSVAKSLLVGFIAFGIVGFTRTLAVYMAAGLYCYVKGPKWAAILIGFYIYTQYFGLSI